MPRSALKNLRVLVGCAILIAFSAAFLDLRSSLPTSVIHALAAVQIVPALIAVAGSLAALATLLTIVVVTLVAGRLYCSTLCPLGLLQDLVARLDGWIRPRKRPLPFVQGSRWLRYGVLVATIFAAALGAGGIASTWVDPYSHFGRILSALVRPIAGVLNNAVVSVAHSLGVDRFNRVTISWPTLGIALVAGGVAVLVVVLVAWRRRYFCNTLCPVGTGLGLLARVSAFRLKVDRSACQKCARCLHRCKAQCIDLRTGTLDASRCVSCFNCIEACDRGAVRYTFSWRRRSSSSVAPTAPATTSAACSSDTGRRAFVVELASAVARTVGAVTLLGVAVRADEVEDAGASLRRTQRGRTSRPQATRAICPPGAVNLDRFLDRCTACNLCVTACPTHVLRPAFLEYGLEGMMKPRLDYSVSFCNFDCHRCGDVCPDGALQPIDLDTKHQLRIGEAHLDLERCIVKTNGTDCAACSEHCPTKALDTKPYGDNLRLPFLQRESCIGCGACEYACPAAPVKAVHVTGERQHHYARPVMERPVPPPPPPSGDFPF